MTAAFISLTSTALLIMAGYRLGQCIEIIMEKLKH